MGVLRLLNERGVERSRIKERWGGKEGGRGVGRERGKGEREAQRI